jgi:hypothetical protein
LADTKLFVSTEFDPFFEKIPPKVRPQSTKHSKTTLTEFRMPRPDSAIQNYPRKAVKEFNLEFDREEYPTIQVLIIRFDMKPKKISFLASPARDKDGELHRETPTDFGKSNLINFA